MWHAVKSSEHNYFYKCSVEEESSTITYYLYDLKEIWSEECTITEITQRSKNVAMCTIRENLKNLNKRICYDSETVKTTLQTGVPTSVSIESGVNERKMILKYHIMERPFNFEWNLRPLDVDNVQKLITNPLFLSIHYLAEQIKELKNTILKKDIEIKAYIEEGAVLGRKTVATEEFNEDSFDSRYKQINDMSKGFLEISESIKKNFPLTEVKVIPENKNKSTNRSSTFHAIEKSKKKPNKKRKILENRQLQMLNIAKSKQNELIEYESSQSQTLSETPPKDEELAEIFQSLDELNAKRLASNADYSF